MKYGFVKACACTPEIRVADVEFNAKNVSDAIDVAAKIGVELIVFPELTLTGATCGDLFFSSVLIDGAKDALKKIAEGTADKKLLAFIGLPLKNGNLIYNVTAAVCGGKVLAFIPKTNTYPQGELSDSGYFSVLKETTVAEFFGEEIPFGKNVIFKDIENPDFTVAAEIGADLFAPISPSTFHAAAGANIIANPSATAAVVGKTEYVKDAVRMQSRKSVCGYVTAGAGNGESTTDMVFGGYDVIAEVGTVLNESALFENGLTVSEIDLSFIAHERAKVFNTSLPETEKYLIVPISVCSDGEELTRKYRKTPFVPVNEKDVGARAELVLSIQAEALKKRISHAHANSAVLGLSGGLDSTLAILVAVTAMQKLNRSVKDVVAVTMPCFGTTSRTYLNTIKLARALGVTLKKIDITKSVTRHLKDLKHAENEYDVTFENAQARERTQVLMDVANMNGGLVVGTGDLSEVALGWATYNGDHMSMYGVNCTVPKTLVRHVVESYAKKSKGALRSVLNDILDTPVSPELLPSENDAIAQKTEDIVGPYILHDFFLYNMIRRGYSPAKLYFVARKTFEGDFKDETVLKWLKIFIKRFFTQQFKRSCVPDGVKVGSVGLSPRGDWKMPSDAVYACWMNELENL